MSQRDRGQGEEKRQGIEDEGQGDGNKEEGAGMFALEGTKD